MGDASPCASEKRALPSSRLPPAAASSFPLPSRSLPASSTPRRLPSASCCTEAVSHARRRSSSSVRSFFTLVSNAPPTLEALSPFRSLPSSCFAVNKRPTLPSPDSRSRARSPTLTPAHETLSRQVLAHSPLQHLGLPLHVGNISCRSLYRFSGFNGGHL
ncbi:hypothetical protein BDY21DRAFT_9098 [Lineolata rhizophorae]|uniref:Uncharacterized protein n=1 Tax=Lineolata rhizophorae TaxID=578093 RepID=A0A6A6PE06_9PEZI|nr:hypothetical protein BDY21DRAFT_9098 [Lineolata rhizophorae]